MDDASAAEATATETAADAAESAVVAGEPAAVSPAETKAALRQLARKARAGIAPDERERKSALICKRAAVLLDSEAERCVRAAGKKASASPSNGAPFTLAVYAAMRDEVSLDGLVRHAYERGWRVGFPAMIGADGGEGSDEAAEPMSFFLLGRAAYECGNAPFLIQPTRRFSKAELIRGGYDELAPEVLDGIVVPLLAFDDQGGRLGYGGGNYDRYLPRLRRDACIMGAAFREQHVDCIPQEAFDVALSCVLTA